MVHKVEELVKTSTLLTPPPYRTLEGVSRELAESNRRYANLKASIISTPSHWPEPTEAERAVGEILARKFASNPPLMDTVDRFGKFALGVGQAAGRLAEASLPFFEGFAAFVNTAVPAVEKFLRPNLLHPVELAAHDALGALMEGRMQEVERFLAGWLRIPEPDIETHEALMYVLRRNFERPLSEFGNPGAWLRVAVLTTRTSIIAERDQMDTYSQILAEASSAEEDAYHAPGKTFYLPPRTPYVGDPADSPDPFVRARNTGMRAPSGEDPCVLVARKHGSRRQVVEELAASGRLPTRDRARVTLEYRQELEDREVAFSRKDLLQRIGGANAERALKVAAQTRHKKILGELG